eukprot:682663-Hanusia_phi.AAC.1
MGEAGQGLLLAMVGHFASAGHKACMHVQATWSHLKSSEDLLYAAQTEVSSNPSMSADPSLVEDIPTASSSVQRRDAARQSLLGACHGYIAARRDSEVELLAYR